MYYFNISFWTHEVNVLPHFGAIFYGAYIERSFKIWVQQILLEPNNTARKRVPGHRLPRNRGFSVLTRGETHVSSTLPSSNVNKPRPLKLRG